MKRRWWVFVAAAAAFILAYALVEWTDGVHETPRPWDGPASHRDLSAIARDTLRVIVCDDPLVWEPNGNGGNGLAWQWLARFAKAQGMAARVVVLSDADSMLTALWQGQGDIIAAPLYLDRGERRHFHRMEPFAAMAPMLVSLRPEYVLSEEYGPWPDSAHIAQGSPYAHHAYKGWAREGPKRTIDPEIDGEEDLLVEVLLGRREAAVVSRVRALHDAARFPALQFEGPLGAPIPWGLIVRRDADTLRSAIAAWQGEPRERQAMDQLLRERTGPVPPPGPIRMRRMKGLRADSISPFDQHFREQTKGMKVDWRLLAAMAWKESRFDSSVTSRKGASGIMQIMPRTAARFGLDTASAVEDHIHAAARYMAKLDTMWYRAVPNPEQRLRFVLASYNAGPGHIIDAQRLAAQLGLADTLWEGNVERAVLLLAKPRYYQRPGMKNGYCKGSQVFHYVRGVLAIHEQVSARTNR